MFKPWQKLSSLVLAIALALAIPLDPVLLRATSPASRWRRRKQTLLPPPPPSRPMGATRRSTPVSPTW
jgi:hypothetical protein